MKIFKDYKDIRGEIKTPAVITIGNFDGVHLGHQEIINQSQKLADDEGLTHIVCTFEPHPAHFFFPDNSNQRLCRYEKKYETFEKMGIKYLLAQKFDSTFASMEAKDFVKDIIKDALNAHTVIVGDNFHFGKNKCGDISLLKSEGVKHGFDVLSFPLIKKDDQIISSSKIRDFLKDGLIENATKLLGRFYFVHGTVVDGKKTGRKLGFPTINLNSPEVLVPADGIYAAICEFDDNSKVAAALYIGERPTLGAGHSIEAHLLDFDRDIYGKQVYLKFVTRIRDDIKFEDSDKLVIQIKKDIEKIRTVTESYV